MIRIINTIQEVENTIKNNRMKTPKIIINVINKIFKQWIKDENVIRFVRGHTEDDFAGICQSILLSNGIAMKIRNCFKLWDSETPIHQSFKNDLKIEHPDDMSDYIIRHVYQKIKNKYETHV